MFRHTEKLSFAMGTGENGVGYWSGEATSCFRRHSLFTRGRRAWELSPGFEANDFGFGRPVTDGCISLPCGTATAGGRSQRLVPEPTFSRVRHWL